MLATKEQERKALEKIRKIITDLGEDSYIGTAFEGCFEIAEENINNDFACSMKQRAEKATEEAEYFKSIAERESANREEYEARVRQLEPKELTHPLQIEIHNAIIVGINALETEKDSLEKTIIEYAMQPLSEEFQNAVKRHTAVKEQISRMYETINKTAKMVEGRH